METENNKESESGEYLVVEETTGAVLASGVSLRRATELTRGDVRYTHRVIWQKSLVKPRGDQ